GMGLFLYRGFMHHLLSLLVVAAVVSFASCGPKNSPPKPQIDKAKQKTAKSASKKQTSVANAEKKPDYDAVKLHDESDKTDLFAIPLDTSEAEETPEINALEQNMEQFGEK